MARARAGAGRSPSIKSEAVLTVYISAAAQLVSRFNQSYIIATGC